MLERLNLFIIFFFGIYKPFRPKILSLADIIFLVISISLSISVYWNEVRLFRFWYRPILNFDIRVLSRWNSRKIRWFGAIDVVWDVWKEWQKINERSTTFKHAKSLWAKSHLFIYQFIYLFPFSSVCLLSLEDYYKLLRFLYFSLLFFIDILNIYSI